MNLNSNRIDNRTDITSSGKTIELNLPIFQIEYVKGSVLEPIGEGHKIIAHVANNSGGWGRGFVMELSKKWDLPELVYRKSWQKGINMTLGSIQMCCVEDGI